MHLRPSCIQPTISDFIHSHKIVFFLCLSEMHLSFKIVCEISHRYISLLFVIHTCHAFQTDLIYTCLWISSDNLMSHFIFMWTSSNFIVPLRDTQCNCGAAQTVNHDIVTLNSPYALLNAQWSKHINVLRQIKPIYCWPINYLCSHQFAYWFQKNIPISMN